MHTARVWVWVGLFAAAAAWSVGAFALPPKGAEVPNLHAEDIRGNEVDLYQLLAESPDDLAILFFFTTDTGEAFAARLRQLNEDFKDASLRIIAVGLKEDEAALRAFAERLKIEYYIIPDTPEVSANKTYGPFAVLPVTFIVTPQRTLLRAVSGSGEAEADVITYIAQSYLMRNQPAKAEAAADIAAKAGENERKARESKGYALVKQGKLDEATQEFQQIDSKAGLAAVALEQGEYEKAAALADQATDDAYASAVKGEALLRSGKPDQAAQAFDAAASKPLDDWQKNAAVRGAGRALQEQGDKDAAVSRYDQALELNPWDVTALSNTSAVRREQGDLKGAEAALARAEAVAPNDDMVGIMLRQIRAEMEKANDTQRRELIQKQIADLQQRYKDLKAAGKDKPADEWTSRPLVVAFLPAGHKPVFFDRVGTDIAIQRELETRLQDHPRIQVVEREVLDALLQELNLGTSDLADPDTQLRLGKVLSAQLLGFADFAQNGPETTMYLRMVDTETTSIDSQVTRPLPRNEAAITAFVDALEKELEAKVLASRKLQGLIAEVASPEEIWINLGGAHGVQPGQQFVVLQDGGPIEVGGRVIGHRQVPVGTLEVTQVEDLASICKTVKKKDGVDFSKEMKVKEAIQAPAAAS